MGIQKEMYLEAQKYMVGGGSAGGRFNATLGQPLYMDRCEGAYLYDAEGKRYIDYHSSAGPALFGYKNPRLKKAALEAMERGFFWGYDTQETIELARQLCRIIPCAERVRLVNTGSEATLSALRLARAYTGKEIVIRFEGHFHGMHELLWYNHNGEGDMDSVGEIRNVPDGAGIPACFGDVVKNVEFNDFEALERVVERCRGKTAAVIMEPISYNCGCYPAKKEYLEKVRSLCSAEGIVLIFDEVICGYRMRPGSAQAYYGVTPDLTTLAKAIGGGFPIAAVAGKKEIMEMGGPTGPAGVSGTYSGALMSVMAALECAKMVQEPDFYDRLESIGNALYSGIDSLMKKHGIKGHVRGVGARFGLYFGVEDPEDDFNWRTVKKKFDADLNGRFLTGALEEGIYFHNYGTSPVPAHNGFGIAHSAEDIDFTLDRIDKIFKRIR
ncbi:aspartate aminotransferase family protein [Bacilliculturomica massiliensis]|uniref:aspartate aminotransferase family protein n=1 Tax=Bacilliculturomica massiliensis TaxID=1917867 RepID=UPI001031AAD3|nr:aspartate aminotransferase family protein [Bacilliculturomica massiliensis]